MRSVKKTAWILPLIAVAADAQTKPALDEPGVGVICALGIYNAVAEVGRQCFPEQDLAFKAELIRSLAKLDSYVLKNATLTAADLARFKQEQAHVGQPKDLICTDEMSGMYQASVSAGASKLTKHVDALIARPGNLTWGDCF